MMAPTYSFKYENDTGAFSHVFLEIAKIVAVHRDDKRVEIHMPNSVIRLCFAYIRDEKFHVDTIMRLIDGREA